MSKSDYWLFRLLHKHRYLISVLAIIFAAAVIRLFQIASIPPGLTWDETAIGYSGYSIATTGRDEWLELLPISFRSFGDYKAPVAIYLNGIFTLLFGLSPLVVRLPFALSGVAAVLGIILLTKELWRYHPQANLIAIISGTVLTLSPWHIQFTRAGFESGLALTEIIWATWLFVVAIKNKQVWHQILFLAASAALFTLSLYTYHSTKLFAPLWVLFLAFTFRNELYDRLKAALVSGGLGITLVAPLLYDSVYGSSLERAGVTVFSQAESFLGAIFITIQNFLVHLSPGFLILGEVDSLRHGDGVWGVLLATTASMAFLGSLWLIKTIARNIIGQPTKYQQIFVLAVFYTSWIILGLLPAAIGQEIPHSNRSLMALPGFIGLAAVGFIMLKQWLQNTKLNSRWKGNHGEKNMLVKAFIGSVAVVHFFLFASYFEHYLNKYPAIASDAYIEGYMEVMELAEKYEKGLDGYPKVDKIYISGGYGQPYIFTLFAKQASPYEFHQGILRKYMYQDEITIADFVRENALLIATSKDDVPIGEAKHILRGSDGEVKFKIYLSDEVN